jgi:hypothetical protein
VSLFRSIASVTRESLEDSKVFSVGPTNRPHDVRTYTICYSVFKDRPPPGRCRNRSGSITSHGPQSSGISHPARLASRRAEKQLGSPASEVG